jgi:hypothetical protein
MHRIAFAVLFALVACKHPVNDDMDGGSLPGSMCTTPDCANNPCTPGCVFARKSGGCPCEYPTTIATPRVTACPNRCGLRSNPNFPPRMA